MSWWRRDRKRLVEADEKLRAAEKLRDEAQALQKRVEDMTPRIDAIASNARQLRQDNHFGPLIDAILRGDK